MFRFKTQGCIFKNAGDHSALMIEILKAEVDISKIGFKISNMCLKGNARRFDGGPIGNIRSHDEGFGTASLILMHVASRHYDRLTQ